MSDAYYDTAQVCLNGHVITSGLRLSPARAAKRCEQCGAETLSKCPKCQADIRGYYNVPRVVSFSEYVPPSFCHECGSAYPWTEERLNAAAELIDLTTISTAEKESIKRDLPSLLTDTPRTKVAATKMGQLLQKAGQTVGPALRDIVVDIASEAAKKIIFPGP